MTVRKFTKLFLIKLGLYAKEITDKEKVKKLIDSLHPYQIQKNMVRLGSNVDGGYVLPDDFEGIEAVFSPGVEEKSSFELDCYQRGMKIFMADKSIEKPKLNLSDQDYSFIKKFIGHTIDDDFTTMDNWVNSSNISKNSDLLLQMDIESGEYFSIINMSDELLQRFRIIVIEFHDLHNLWDRDFFWIAETVFNKLLKHHNCVHIHPNNTRKNLDRHGLIIPEVMEFTFFRKDRDDFNGYQTKFPHPLDTDNEPERKHIPLPQTWYHKA